MAKKKPSIKQKLALKKVLETGVSVPQAMREAGYSPSTIHNSNKITQSPSWQELLDLYLPDAMLTRKMNEGLEANKQLATRVVFKKDAPTSQSAHELPAATSMTDDFIEVPDFAVRHKYMETALKVKGKLIDRKDITTDGEKLEAVEVVIIEDKTMANE